MAKASFLARKVATNTLNRVRKDREAGKAYPAMSHDELALEIETVAMGAKFSERCERCGVRLRFGDKAATPISPSCHKVRPSLGYVKGNVSLVCFQCNSDIGEAETIEDCERKIAALRWQIEKLNRK